jgi:hypothetical protein
LNTIWNFLTEKLLDWSRDVLQKLLRPFKSYFEQKTISIMNNFCLEQNLIFLKLIQCTHSYSFSERPEAYSSNRHSFVHIKRKRKKKEKPKKMSFFSSNISMGFCWTKYLGLNAAQTSISPQRSDNEFKIVFLWSRKCHLQ